MAEVSLAEPTGGPELLRVRFLDAADEYFVYEDGRLVARTTVPWHLVTVRAGEAKYLEVYDSAADVPRGGYGGQVWLGWEPDASAEYYTVQRYIEEEWVDQAVLAFRGESWLSWASEYLADVTEHQFRVVATMQQNTGPAREATLLVVRQPDQPGGTLSYDAGTGELTWTF